jgi:glucose/arabinose dehydrogenase
VEKFQNGSDPFSLFKTITRGFKNMPSQTWMTPEQRYDVVQYVRETFVKTLNPSQYSNVDKAYLDSLPKFDPSLAKAQAGSRARQSDYGPVLESQLGTNIVDALTFRLSDDVGLSYDLHRMCLVGAWQGGFLDLSRTGHAEQRGEGQPLPRGKPLPGLQKWYWAFGGRFDYPTNDVLPRGPLPASWMKYFGHYVYNRQAILSYSIEGRRVLELPSAEKDNDLLTISHTLRIEPGATPMRLCVAQSESASAQMSGLVERGQTVPTGTNGPVTRKVVLTADAGAASGYGDFVTAGALGATEGLAWDVDEQHRLILNIPADEKPRVVRVVCASGNGPPALERFSQYLDKTEAEPVVDTETVTHGGARLWPLEIAEKGRLGEETNAYALDTVPVPFDNPYGAWLRTSALAFFPDGRAAVTTYGGDVWILSGLDKPLDKVSWSRFASGLYEPFGVAVVDGVINVTCRNGIVRLHDLNNDGEADFYETWYADTDVSTFFHSFNFDLQVDHRGHFYYVKAGEYTDYKLPGAVLDIMPDGSKAEVYCTGFRVPNGMGMLPDGRLTVSDNQGDWMPASKINIVHRGGFYGYVQDRTGVGGFGDHWAPDGGRIDAAKVQAPPTFDQPIIWMPQEFDNSSSGQVWVDDPRFGPLSGRLLHASYGKGWIYYLMIQDTGSVSQAAIVALPFQFDAGLMRARIDPADGQLYATGLSGWQGPDQGKDGCLQRLRYTGKPIKMLDDVKICRDGLSLQFNFPLDRASSVNITNYHLEQWNYLWSSNYGSDQYSLEHPGQKGHDVLKITSVKLSEDGREALLSIPGLRPVNQIEIRLALTAADGAPWKELAYLTINAVPER